MSKSILVDLNLNRNELQNVVIQNLSTAPSNPIEGLMYYNTNDHLVYVYDGTNWINATSTGDYIFTNGIQELTGSDAGKVTLKLATGASAGNITFTADSDGLSGNAPIASTSEAGLIEIATDNEASAGISETLAVNPKQLADAVKDKIELTDLSIDSNSTNYLTYNNTTGAIGANVDTSVTASSTNLITSGAVETAIANALVGGIIYKGTWDATNQTDYSSIALPVKQGYMYYVSGGTDVSITAGGTTIIWNEGDYLLVNADVASGGILTDVSKLDNTEASDIVRLDATQTITNKTIDADDNTITNLETDNFKSGIVVTSSTGIAPVSTASDTKIVTEKAIAEALATTQKELTAGDGITIQDILDGSLTPDWYKNNVVLDPIPETINTPSVGTTDIYKPFNNQTFSNSTNELVISWDVLYANPSSATGSSIILTGSDGTLTIHFDGSYQGQNTTMTIQSTINSSQVLSTSLSMPYIAATYIHNVFTFNRTTKEWSITCTELSGDTVIGSDSGTASVDIIPDSSIVSIQMGNDNGSENGIKVKTAAFSVASSEELISQISVNNTIQRTANLVTSISASSTDTQYPSAKCLYDALFTNRIININNPVLTTSDGVCTWSIVNSIGTTNILVQVFENSTGAQVVTEVGVTANIITITMNSSSNIAADTYRAVIMG